MVSSRLDFVEGIIYSFSKESSELKIFLFGAISEKTFLLNTLKNVFNIYGAFLLKTIIMFCRIVAEWDF